MEITETLLGVSAIYLFGRRLTDLVLKANYEAQFGKANGVNNMLRDQLTSDGENNDARLARIFAFSFEGTLVELPKPTIFVVHGVGIDPDDPAPTNPELARLARMPGPSGSTGLGYQHGSFAKGIRAWVYDKSDYSMRLDVETGPLEQILLGSDGGFDGLSASSGVMARSSGGLARSSGVMARSSGWMARRSGSND